MSEPTKPSPVIVPPETPAQREWTDGIVDDATFPKVDPERLPTYHPWPEQQTAQAATPAVEEALRAQVKQK